LRFVVPHSTLAYPAVSMCYLNPHSLTVGKVTGMYNFRTANQLNDKLTLAYPAKTYSAEHRLSDSQGSQYQANTS